MGKSRNATCAGSADWPLHLANGYDAMRRWDAYQDGKWVDGVQARGHFEALFEALADCFEHHRRGVER
jgi:hypothetical protein